jgi:hypothetical protein
METLLHRCKLRESEKKTAVAVLARPEWLASVGHVLRCKTLPFLGTKTSRIMAKSPRSNTNLTA